MKRIAALACILITSLLGFTQKIDFFNLTRCTDPPRGNIQSFTDKEYRFISKTNPDSVDLSKSNFEFINSMERYIIDTNKRRFDYRFYRAPDSLRYYSSKTFFFDSLWNPIRIYENDRTVGSNRIELKYDNLGHILEQKFF